MARLRKIIITLLILTFNSYSFAEVFKLEETPLKKAIPTIYEQVLNKPYMVDPIILDRKENISFYLDDSVTDKYTFFKRYLENINIKIYTKNGIDYLKYVEPVKIEKKKPKPKGYSYVYRPKYRGVTYLSETLSGFLESAGAVDKDQSFKGSINSKGDVLLVHADKDTIAKVKSILPQIDTKPKQVIVMSRLVEVKKAENSQSGIKILADIIRSKLSINFNLGQLSDNVVSLKTNNISTIFGILDTDSQFNVISSPILRVMDSERGNFTVGSDVPTLGAETVERDGSRRRDINYRSSGVIFEIKPVITAEGVKMSIISELSDFTKTETGVDNTPTLLKRLLDSTVYVNDGGLIVLGGLSEEKQTKTKDNFFGLPFGKSKKWEKSDILLLLMMSTM